MIINEMDHFESVCKESLLRWYNNHIDEYNLDFITINDIFITNAVKALKNYKCLVSTRRKDGIYAEYTYNGTTGELYEDVYRKLENNCL